MSLLPTYVYLVSVYVIRFLLACCLSRDVQSTEVYVLGVTEYLL